MSSSSSSHPEITITYFDIPGRVEPSRLALYIADIPFKDERLSHEQWKHVKPNAPFGKIPMMTVNGTLFAESNAMLRYAGCLSGLYPSDPLKALLVDMFLDKLKEIGYTLYPSFEENDMEKKIAMRKSLVSDKLFHHWAQVDQIVCKTSPNYAAGDGLTIADLEIFQFANWFKEGALAGIPTYFMDQFKNIGKVGETVRNHPRVQDWYKQHPVKPPSFQY